MSLPSLDATTAGRPAMPAPRALAAPDRPARALAAAVRAWFAVALAGQALFAAYVVLAYGRAALAGRPDLWNRIVPHSWTPGAAGMNALFASHVLLTVLVLASGALQLLPSVRRRAPALHRWNGRFYLVAAIATALGGLAMLAVRHAAEPLAQRLPLATNAALVALCAILAWHRARARRYQAHSEWALRAWLATLGVWFFRLGITAWIVANRGPVGFDPDTFTGPAITAFAWAQTLVPLAVFEAWRWVRRAGGPRATLVLGAGLGAATLLTAGGIATAAMLLWLSRM